MFSGGLGGGQLSIDGVRGDPFVSYTATAGENRGTSEVLVRGAGSRIDVANDVHACAFGTTAGATTDVPVEKGGTLAAQNIHLGEGALLHGSGGTILGNGGTVVPGNSPGTMAIVGDFFLDGLREIELGDGAQGVGHDRLDVQGELSFGANAEIVVAFTDGFAPEKARSTISCPGRRWTRASRPPSP